MKEAENINEGLGMMATLEQVVKALGFHDLSSFFMVCIFLLISIAFIISFALFLVKKRRERLDELHKIVIEVQKPLVEPVQSTPREFGELEQNKALTPQPAKKPKNKKPKSQPTLTVGPKPEPTGAPESALRPESVSKPEALAPLEPEVAVLPETRALALPKLEEVVPPAKLAETKPNEQRALGAALKNTRGGFMEKLARLFSKKAEINDADFEEIEEILFTADIGTKTAQKLLDVLRQRVSKEKNHDKSFFFTVLKGEMCRILTSAPSLPILSSEGPRVVMFVGVNGAGKTTSIGKLGARLKDAGKKVVFGAGDTYRAAALTQLSVWGERVSAEVVSGKENADSASVLFEAIMKAKNTHADYALCDTAGRLHTKTSLMDELKKVHRVMAKAQSGAPHEVYLVIDATMGQNAIAQAREFANATPLTGIVLSKLDGTAKGGVAIGIVDELKVPIRYIGIGEQVGDFKDFDATLFVDALFEEI